MGVFHQGIFPPVTIGEQMYTLDELQYHTSWDWLIPVAQKIIDVYISIDEQDEQELQQSILHDKIDAVYRIVVEIIKEYNDGQG